MCALSGADRPCASLAHARSLRTSTENASNLRLVGGERGIRTPGTAKAYMGGFRPKCGALFGPNKSIRAGENLFARGSALIWISSVPFFSLRLMPRIWRRQTADEGSPFELRPP